MPSRAAASLTLIRAIHNKVTKEIIPSTDFSVALFLYRNYYLGALADVANKNAPAMLETSGGRPNLLGRFDVSNLHHFSNPGTFADDFTAELDAEQARLDALRCDDAAHDAQRADAGRCEGCGDLTEGAMIVGVRCMICPACLEQFVARHTAPAKLPKPRPVVDHRKFIHVCA